MNVFRDEIEQSRNLGFLAARRPSVAKLPLAPRLPNYIFYLTTTTTFHDLQGGHASKLH